jgi:hypothetical protein
MPDIVLLKRHNYYNQRINSVAGRPRSFLLLLCNMWPPTIGAALTAKAPPSQHRQHQSCELNNLDQESFVMSKQDIAISRVSLLSLYSYSVPKWAFETTVIL